MERRDFLKFLTTALYGTSMGGLSACQVAPIQTQGGSRKKGTVFLAYQGDTSASSRLKIYNWDNGSSEDFTIPLALPHSIIKDRFDPNTLYIFEVLGSCVKINLKSRETLKVEHSHAEGLFNGHAVQSNSGEHLFCTQIEPARGQAVVTVRSAQDLSFISDLPAPFNQAHHVIEMPGTSILACGNMSASSGRQLKEIETGISFFDYTKNEVIRQVKLEDSILHLLPLSGTELVGIGFNSYGRDRENLSQTVTADKSSLQNIHSFYLGGNTITDKPVPLYVVSLDGGNKKLWDESHRDDCRYGFGLSKVAESQRFISGYLTSNKIMLWENFQVVKTADVARPTNIIMSQDGSEFIVASDGKARIFSVERFSELRAIENPRQLLLASAYS